MLQAYIDESCTDGAVFVMAGYIATAEKWTAFSDEWSSLLGLGAPHWRSIEEFKMSSMSHSQLGIEQSELFYRVIEKHLGLHISCSVRLKDLRHAYNSIDWPNWMDNSDLLTNEYYNAFEAIVKSLATKQEQLGISGPIDIIFDEHSNKAKCLHSWDIMKRGGHPKIRSMLGDAPIFRDSKTSMPLQAADLLAYWLRACQVGMGNDYSNVTLKFPWEMKSSSMRGIHIYFTPDMLRDNFRNILLASFMARAGVHPDTITHVVSLGAKSRH